MQKRNQKKRKLPFFVVISITLLVVFSVPFLFILRLNYGNPYEQYLLEKHVPTYLEQMGYEQKDIAKQHTSEPKGSSNQDYLHTQYAVIFKNEAGVTYYYGLKKKGKTVVQFCERNSYMPIDNEQLTKHSEDTCVSYDENQ